MTHITCPYCNAIIAGVTDARVDCPNCGMSFTYDQGVYNRAVSASAPPAEPKPEPRSNRKVALIILGVMLAAGAVGLVYALVTLPDRQKRHPAGGADILKAKPYRPPELTALGFLPLETNLVAAVHVAQLLENPEGKKLLEPPLPVGLDWLRRNLDHWTGIPFEAVDHIVLGTQIKDRLPQFTIAVQTRGTYDSAIVGRKHQTQLQLHKKPLFPIKVDPMGEGFLWCPNNQTLVVAIRLDAIKLEDMAPVPVRPWGELEAFPKPLREVIEKRLPQNSQVWAAGHLEQAELLTNLLAFVPRAKTPVELISKVRTFGLGLEIDKEATLQGAVRMVDAQSAELVKAGLAKVADLPELKVVELEDQWLGIQARASVERLRQTLTVPAKVPDPGRGPRN